MRFQLRSLNNNFRTPTLILVVLLGAPGVRAAAQSIPTILLPAAIVDRPYNRITLIMPFSAYFQVRASWQHGTLPPEFQCVGNLFTLGVTFSNPGSVEH